MNGTEPALLPVVDIQSICKNGGEDVEEEKYLQVGKKIVEAFQEFGYVYLENSGIMKKTIDALLEDMESFFKLDAKTKEKYQRNLLTLHGYSTDKTEVISSEETPMSERQMFDFGINGLIPDEAPKLRDSVPNLNDQVFLLISKVLKSLELALDIPDNLLQKNHDLSSSDNFTELRVLKYAPVIDEAQIRIKEHFDWDTFTFQVYESSPGLQIQDKNGIWHNAQITPKTILLFPSKLLEIMTADKILATKHRVTVPTKAEGKQQHRYSLIYFVLPNKNAVIKPLDGSAKYKPRLCKTIVYRAMKTYTSDWVNYEEYRKLDE